MKSLLTTLLILVSISSVSAQTLEGEVEKRDTVLNGSVNQMRIERPVYQIQTNQNQLQGQTQGFQLQGQGQGFYGQSQIPQSGQLPLIGRTSGGEQTIGCLGATVNVQTGLVERVYPASNLNQFGIHVGDRVLEIANHRFDGASFTQDCLGVPGQPLELVILHDGHPIQIYPLRVDARALAPDAPFFQQWANQTKRW